MELGRAGSPMYLWVPYKEGYKSFNCFSLSCKDAQDKNDWRLRIKGVTG